MIPANESRQQTEQNINNLIKSELNYLEGRIKESIANGEFNVIIGKSLRKETVAKLKELGYSVSVDSQYNDTYYNISWGDSNKTH